MAEQIILMNQFSVFRRLAEISDFYSFLFFLFLLSWYKYIGGKFFILLKYYMFINSSGVALF